MHRLTNRAGKAEWLFCANSFDAMPLAQTTSSNALTELERQLKRLAQTVAEAEKLYANRKLTQRSMDAIVEFSFAASYASFERFLEDHFYAVLLGASSIPKAAPLVQFQSRAQFEQIVIAGRQYLKWLPFKEGVMSTAGRFLSGGVPFDRLIWSTAEQALLENARVLRNAISHRTESANVKTIPLIESLPARRRTIAGYLLTSAQGRTHFKMLTTNFHAVARALVEPDPKSARQYLSPEAPHDAGKKAGAGTFRCTNCGHKHQTGRKAVALPGCVACKRKKRTKWERVW